jgi:hypothetical protein
MTSLVVGVGGKFENSSHFGWRYLAVAEVADDVTGSPQIGETKMMPMRCSSSERR